MGLDIMGKPTLIYMRINLYLTPKYTSVLPYTVWTTGGVKGVSPSSTDSLYSRQIEMLRNSTAETI